nr:hypothetical protein Iba_chr13eCG9930 [Ipomoea batatas]
MIQLGLTGSRDRFRNKLGIKPFNRFSSSTNQRDFGARKGPESDPCVGIFQELRFRFSETLKLFKQGRPKRKSEGTETLPFFPFPRLTLLSIALLPRRWKSEEEMGGRRCCEQTRGLREEEMD